ncbi:MAG: hypothetical protein Q8O16_03570 [Dehalococcoidia bacterium]|nr:hypothetical protein [Dehalococcoidia bacterium]
MAEELGKIERPKVEDFRKGRKLYFVPLIYTGKEPPADYAEKFNKYWEQVESQIANLELKLGQVKRIFHELIAEGGESGLTMLKLLSPRSYEIVRSRVEMGGQLEATEEDDVLTEFMDWNRCLAIGLRSPTVAEKVYEAYREAYKKRNEQITSRLNEALKEDEIGILLMAEDHHVQFPSDIQIIYVAPPALDEIKRWLRDWESRRGAIPEEETKEQEPKEDKGQTT